MTPGQPVLVRVSADLPPRVGTVGAAFTRDGARSYKVRMPDQWGNGGALLTVPERVVTPVRA